jgi:hypothetical protein
LILFESRHIVAPERIWRSSGHLAGLMAKKPDIAWADTGVFKQHVEHQGHGLSG